MERSAPCRAIVCLLLTISCLFNLAAARAENPPSEPLTPGNADRLEQAIRAKRAQIDALNKEVKELERQLANNKQVEIEIKIYEVSRTKMRRQGIDWNAIHKGTPYSIATSDPLSQEESSVTFMKALESNNLAKMISHGKFKVVCGEQYTFKSGDEISFSTSPDKKSIRKVHEKAVTVKAILLENGAYRVEVFSEMARIDYENPVRVSSQVIPIFSRFDAAFEMQPGWEILNPGFQVQKHTVAIDSESGSNENLEEIETYLSIKIKPVAAEPSDSGGV